MKNFEILVTDVPDRENLVAEIWYNEILIAEINQETEKLQIEFFLNEKLNLELDAFCYALETAKNKIIIANEKYEY
ncbi:hypothetical protein ODZ84_09835 [Chryseobacterium fluminis]|uniref:hypothetical protein n=1 Tax=Chryseobacterium fluminis TaxID=2983606 RepID=UPI002256103A|nr:hypothetical protein [Chryseobacterium sp. MMS21-Ot14]UZT99833.1 hypothetical protein ODZ84_09835 [Chryseobacterium sp. MMS21-Ot14]